MSAPEPPRPPDPSAVAIAIPIHADLPPPLPPDAARPVLAGPAADAPPAPAPARPSRTRRRVLRTVERMARATLFGASLGTGAGVVGLAAGIGAYVYAVVAHPGPALERTHIQAIVAQESPVTYRDGDKRVGVFFEQQHRRYVSFDELPVAYVMSLVAIEDRRFWSHWGFDPRGMGRAVRENLAAGHIVAGGSTLTQQTAKNLFDRPDRSLRAKGVELLNALRLEAHYDKAEILELYANQFHVSGNGRGLGIAARHFFDKEPAELTLAECAFIAGMVKAPTTMDPFWGQDEAWRRAAAARAHDRTAIVLRELVSQPVEAMVGPAPGWQPSSRSTYAKRLAEATEIRTEASRLLDEGFELQFKRGPFRFDRSAALDEIERRLREPPFDALLPGGIDDPRNAGVVVVTTLDADAQREATYALWHHLTEVGTRLEQLSVEDLLVTDHSGPRYDPDFPPQPHEFRLGRVTEHAEVDGKKELVLDLGGHGCRVDREAIVRVASASWQGAKGNTWAKTPTAEVDALTAAIPDGAVVFASIRAVSPEGTAVCDLELRPALQGAVTVVRDGEVLAMVGGNDNRNFNRALAPRQLGSTFKPLVFHAALKLGWSPDDVLDNTRNVFPFSGTFYYPSPDHAPADRVSMAWAGTRSENLASIWLLYHMLDRLDDEQFAALAAATDLAQRPEEDRDAYRERLMGLGVLATRDRVDEALFNRVKRDVLRSLPQSAHPEDLTALQTLNYGWGYTAERKRVGGNAAKLRALEADWRRLDARIDGCLDQHAALATALSHRRVPAPGEVRDLSVRTGESGFEVACGRIPEGFARVSAATLAQTSARPEEIASFDVGGFGIVIEPGEPPRWGNLSSPRVRRSELPEADDLQIDGLHASTLRALRASLASRQEALAALPERPDPYAPEQLYHHGDFRTLLAMRYVAALAGEYGVRSELREVLTLPLGVSEITLEEATVLYEGLITGSAHRPGGVTAAGPTEDLPTATTLIREIRSARGEVLFRAEDRPRAVTSRRVGAMTADILRNVVQHGTGARAKQAVTAGGHPVPLGGKTGTTDDFRNSAFVGFVPAAVEGGYDPAEGFVIGTYVGYDDNRPMVNGGIKLAGASGALPAWIGTAQGLAAAGMLGTPPASDEGLEAGAPWPIPLGEGLAVVTVDSKNGLHLDAAAARPEPAEPGAEPPAAVETATVVVRAGQRAERPEAGRRRPERGTEGWWNRLRRRFSGGR